MCLPSGGKVGSIEKGEYVKTIALTCILKNEAENLERFCQSVAGCFDEYHFTDTGSTDGSLEFLEFRAKEILGDNVHIHYFQWINDFSAARNFALPHIKTDYWAWLDLDDTLSNIGDFLKWKRSSMHISDVWFVPYWYALDKDRNPIIQFARERVFKTSLGCKFMDPIHEGVKFPETCKPSGLQGWHVNHERTEKEMKGDAGRNLKILEDNKVILSTRLKFYLGKEYYDAGRFKEASEALLEPLKAQDISPGDKVLAVQYLCQSLFNLGDFTNCIKYALFGVNIDPTRAEYYCFVGDSMVSSGRLNEAIPFYRAALSCQNKGNGLTHEFTFNECYNSHPKMNLAKIYFNLGQLEQCSKELDGLDSKEANEIREVCAKAIIDADYSQASECEDIVITCPMPAAYPWDEEIYKTKGLGGSETAAVEMARNLKKLTGRCVKIFQEREEVFVAESGVEYHPLKNMLPYFKKWSPKIHVAWRHNVKLTNAPTYVWCHDLVFEGLKETNNYEKILALSPFHKDFIQSMLGIADDKFIITKNGINPDRFKDLKMHKEWGRVIWSNSADRGLEHAIMVMEKVREVIPGASLHVFYGMDNMKKFGMKDKAEMLEKMMSERPWIKYHGSVSQDVLANELAKSQVWLYPASFIETHCISAIEAMVTKAYPVVRNVGALIDTLKPAWSEGMATILDNDPDDYDAYAKEVIEAIEFRKWEDMDLKAEDFSWSGVAEDWKRLFEL